MVKQESQFFVLVQEAGGVLFSAKRPNTRTLSTYFEMKHTLTLKTSNSSSFGEQQIINIRI